MSPLRLFDQLKNVVAVLDTNVSKYSKIRDGLNDHIEGMHHQEIRSDDASTQCGRLYHRCSTWGPSESYVTSPA